MLGIGLFGTLLTLGVAFSVFWMLRRLSGRFWPSCLLAIACCYSFLFEIMPRPLFFSMILFAITLAILLDAHRNGTPKSLYWLPVVFLLWANLHIQFIYGLFAVGLLLAVNVAQRAAVRLGTEIQFLTRPTLSAGFLALVFAGCVLATLIGPYSYRLYGVILSYSHAQLPYTLILELQALSFRAGANYVELLLAGAAFFIIGREKKVDLLSSRCSSWPVR